MSFFKLDISNLANLAKIAGFLLAMFTLIYTYIDSKYKAEIDNEINEKFIINYAFEHSYQSDMQSIQKQYEKIKKDKSDIKFSDMMYIPGQCRRLSNLDSMSSQIGLIMIKDELIESANYCNEIKRKYLSNL